MGKAPLLRLVLNGMVMLRVIRVNRDVEAPSISCLGPTPKSLLALEKRGFAQLQIGMGKAEKQRAKIRWKVHPPGSLPGVV